jgi:legume-like lectin family protein/PEP-CTERM motif-containing protein
MHKQKAVRSNWIMNANTIPIKLQRRLANRHWLTGFGALAALLALSGPCGASSINYTNFSSIAGLTLNGTARQSGNEVTLTTAAQSDNGAVFEAGSLFYNTGLPLTPGTSVDTSFEFSLCTGPSSPSCSAPPADGITFTFQNSPSGASALGGVGYQLGSGGIPNSVAIAFDTYLVPGVLVVVNGNFSQPTAYNPNVTLTGNMYAWIDYNGSSDLLSVYLNTVDTQPATPVLTANVNLFGDLVPQNAASQMYVGFTGGTGEYDSDQAIMNWNLSTTSGSGVPEPGTLTFAGLGLCAVMLRVRFARARRLHNS